MVKPKFQLRVRRPLRVSGKPNSKAEAIVQRKNINEKNLQIQEAVSWCKENNKRGHSALQIGKFPLIKDRGTIDRRLDGEIKNENKEHLQILTPEEERSVVEFIKNKNRCHQGISRKQVRDLIVDVLIIRNYCNSQNRGGRKYIKLSQNAHRVLKTKNSSQRIQQEKG